MPNPMVTLALKQADEHGKALDKAVAELRETMKPFVDLPGDPEGRDMPSRVLAVADRLEQASKEFRKQVVVLKGMLG